LQYLAALASFCITVAPAMAQGTGGGAAGQQKFHHAEYNAWQAADAEKNPRRRSRCWTTSWRSIPFGAFELYLYAVVTRITAAQKEFPETI